MSKSERIKQVLVTFSGYGLTAKQIAAEAGASLSWTYAVLRRLERDGFAEWTRRDVSGLPARARHYCAVRSAAATYVAETEAAELVAIEVAVDALDFDAAADAYYGRTPIGVDASFDFGANVAA